MDSKNDDAKLKAQAVAYLISRGYAQKEIARILQISQSMVARHRARALKDGWLHETIQFVRNPVDEDNRIDDERMHLIELKIYPYLKEVQARIGAYCTVNGVSSVPTIHIVGCKADGVDGEPAYHRFQAEFGRLAAAEVAPVLARSHRIGVTWGKTISGVIDGLCTMSARFPSPTVFFPVSGEPLMASDIHDSATDLAMRLQSLATGSPDGCPSLKGVCACIGHRFDEKETDKIRNELFAEISGYRRIFLSDDLRKIGRKEPMICEMDALVTGIGTTSKLNKDPWFSQRIGSVLNLNAASVERASVGDIAGVFLECPRAKNCDRKLVQELNSRWTGIQMQHLEQCAKRAGKGRGGVIVVAFGSAKCGAVVQGILRGLINHLVIDEDLSQSLLAKMNVC
jgi:DNA-binding transcriptional regulator LsrR (DeoR family)